MPRNRGQTIETPGKVYHWAQIAFTVDHVQRWHTGGTRHPEVVGTECSCDMHNACTVGGGYVVTRNHTESALSRIYPREQLAIMHAGELFALHSADDTVRHHLAAGYEAFHIGFGTFGLEV